MVIKNLLLAVDAGMGHGETSIFPISIFKVKEGVNYNPEDPNYDLFKLSCKVSAKRLFPNFVFLDSPFNLQYYKPGKPETEVVAMGAVTGDDIITLRIDDEDVVTMPFSVAYDKYAGANHHVEITDRGKFVEVLKWHKYDDAGDWYDVHFDNGRYLRMTSDHPLPTQRGRVLCENLVEGDSVPIAITQAFNCKKSKYDPWLLGVLVCDGNQDGVVSIGLDEKELIDRIIEICGANAVSIKEQHRGPKGNYYDVRIMHGNEKYLPQCPMKSLFGANRKRERSLPNDFLCWSEEDRLSLLAGILDADGFINTNKLCYAQVGSTNKALAIEELLLAESLGFHAKLYETKYGNGEAKRYAVQFRITKDIPLVCKKKIEKLQVVSSIQHAKEAVVSSIKFIGRTGQYRYDVTTASDRFDVSGINSHNCRTRVMGNVYDTTKEIAFSRGNLSFTTINLPRLGIESHGDESVFYEKLDNMLKLAAQQLLDRFEIQAEKHVYNYPFLMGQGVWLDSEKLNHDDKIRDVIKHGTLSIGFIGLAETLVALYGKHHGEDALSQEKGLAIIKHMREFCDRKSQEMKMNFSLLATPAEGLCLAGDTPVQTPNGTKLIRDIKEGDLVVTFNTETNKKELKQVLKSWMTSPARKVMKVSFDHGNPIICTPNHPFGVKRINRNAKGNYVSINNSSEHIEWVEAKDLKKGMRIKSNSIFIDTSGHFRNRNGKNLHRMVWEYYNGQIPVGHVIHHKNENPLDNSLTNLEIMSDADHRRFHLKDTIGWHTWTHENCLGEKNIFYGHKHSNETKALISFHRSITASKKKITDFSLIEEFYSGKSIDALCKEYKMREDVCRYRLFCELGVPYEENHIITSIEYLDEEIPVYDIVVEDNHDFFVGGMNGVLVHNSGRFTRIDKQKYGILPGITDREYYTNSFHIPVYYPILAYKKIELEAPYHALCNAGHISYVELDGDTAKNVDAFESIVRWMHDCHIGYGSINHPVDRDPVCGYVGIIGDTCPRCGRHDGEDISDEMLDKLKKEYPKLPIFQGKV